VKKSQPRVVEAEEFVLKDSKGHVRARLGLKHGHPGLTLIDSKGRTRAGMSLSNEGSSLALFDAHEQIRILAAVMGDEPTMTLYHFNGEPGAFSSLHSTGDSTMVLADPAGKGRLWVKTNMLTTSLGLYDRQGKTRVNLNADHYGLSGHPKPANDGHLKTGQRRHPPGH
jgi:hypothetical protein